MSKLDADARFKSQAGSTHPIDPLAAQLDALAQIDVGQDPAVGDITPLPAVVPAQPAVAPPTDDTLEKVAPTRPGLGDRAVGRARSNQGTPAAVALQQVNSAVADG